VSTSSPPRHQVHQGSSKREALYAFFEQRRVEIHDEAEATPGEFEIGDDLSLVQARQRLDSLDLDDQRFLYEEVNPSLYRG
jgi:hypothetical protein